MRIRRNRKQRTSPKRLFRSALLETLEPRLMFNSDWQNPARHLDVNNDMSISAIDALLIVNQINETDALLGRRTNPLAPYFDTSGDTFLSAIDALLLVNRLNGLGDEPLTVPRVEGESEPAAAGFISIPFTTLPGRVGQNVDLSTTLTIGREEFNEMGLFMVDGPDGSVGGVLPADESYADHVFAIAQRQVLYSRQNVLRLTAATTFPGGANLRAYVLQSTSNDGDTAQHLRVREINTGVLQLGWEQQFSTTSEWQEVGDRGFDDSVVDVRIGEPIAGNAEPSIGAIPNQSVNEETELVVQPVTMDADLPNDELVYSLGQGPVGAKIDPATGRFRWTPGEADGPGNFEVVIRATDRAGAFDTESFSVSVLEVNRAPALADIDDIRVDEGSTVTRLATATDADLPTNALTYSLEPGGPVGAFIDPHTGQFTWSAPAVDTTQDFPVSVRVVDDATPALSDTEEFVVTVRPCPFNATLSGWSVDEAGGSSTLRGTVTSQDCAAVMTEGDSFVVGLEKTFRVGPATGSIRFTYDDPQFDATTKQRINDAFEVALVDAEGNSLVKSLSPSNDAYFNTTQSVGVATAEGVTTSGHTVTVGLDGIPEGTDAKVIFRLANNDADHGTTVKLTSFRILSDRVAAVLPNGSTSKARNLLNTASALSVEPTAAATANVDVDERTRMPSGLAAGEGSEQIPNATLTPAAMERGFKVSSFAKGFEAIQDVGPLGIAFPNSGGVLVTEEAGRIWRFPTLEDGQNLSNATLANTFSQRAVIGLTKANGRVYLAHRNPERIVELDDNGNLVQDIVSNIGSPTGLTTNPIADSSGHQHIFATSGGKLWDIDPIAKTSSVIADGSFDGVASDGRIVYVAEDYKRVVGFDIATKAKVFTSGDAPDDVLKDADGVALGSGILSGKLYVNTGRLGVFEIDTRTNERIQITTSPVSTRGDFVVVAPDGSLLLDLSDEIFRLTPPPGGGFGTYGVSLSASAPGETAGAGSPMIISGDAISVQHINGARQPIAYVTLNGRAVDALDPSGKFFAQVDVLPGENTYTFVAEDIAGQTARATVKVTGTTTNSSIDFSRFADVTASFSGAYFRTSFNEAAKLLDVDLATVNEGRFSIDAPLLVAVKNVSSPQVSVVGMDGLTPDGIPYFDYTTRIENGNLPSGERSTPKSITFHNPSRVPFSYELVFYGQVNEAPIITSLPDIEGLADHGYRYDVNASDADNDLLTYSLDTAPVGMSIESNTGIVNWTPSTGQIGVHDVVVGVSDGRGGKASQKFSLSIIAAPPNRPPEIVSPPPTHAEVGLGDATDVPSKFAPGQLFVASSRTDEIRVYDANTLAFIRSFAHPAFGKIASDSPTFGPGGLAFNSRGNLVVADYEEFVEFSDYGVEYARYPKRVAELTEQIAFDSAGNLYSSTSSSGLNHIEQYRAVDYSFRNSLTLPDQSLTGVTFDELGRLYIASHSSGRIYVLKSDDNYSSFSTWNFFPAPGNSLVGGIQINRDGELVVAASSVSRVNRETGELIGTTVLNDPKSSHQVTVDERGRIYVGDFNEGQGNGAGRVTVLSSDGRELATSSDAELLGPYGMAISHTALPNQRAPSYRYSVIATDPDGDNLRYRFSRTPPAGMIINSLTGVISWSPTADQVGQHSVKVIVEDGRLGAAEQEFVVCVESDPVNRSPVFVSTPPNTAAITNAASGNTEPFMYDADAVDADTDDVLTYSLLTKPEGMMIDANTGVISWNIPSNVASGADVPVRIQVVDNRGGSDEQEFEINVQIGDGEIQGVKFEDVNGDGVRNVGQNLLTNGSFETYTKPPAEWSIPEIQDHNLNSTTTALSGWTITSGVIDYIGKVTPCCNGLTAGWTADDGSFSLDMAGHGGIGAISQSFSTTPGKEYLVEYSISGNPEPGNKKLRINVAGQSVESQFDALAVGNSQTEMNWRREKLTFVATESLTVLSFANVTEGSLEAGPALDNISVREIEPGVPNWGVYLDTNNNSHPDDNEPRAVTDALGNYSFNGLAAGTYSVREEFRPDWVQTYPMVSIGEGASRRVIPAAHTIQVGQGQVVSSVDFGNQRTDVGAGQPPIIESTPPTRVNVGELLRYAVKATDPQGAPLTYSLIDGPAGMTIHPTLGVLVWESNESQLGKHQVVVRIKDSQGNVAIHPFALDVVLPNVNPTFTSTLPSTAVQGHAISFEVHVQDPDEGVVAVTLGTGSVGSLRAKSTTTVNGLSRPSLYEFQWTPTAADVAAGTRLISLVATDDSGGSSTLSKNVTVLATAPNQGPAITSTAPTAAYPGAVYRYIVSAGDPDTDRLTYSLATKPPGMEISSDGVITWSVPSTNLTAQDVVITVSDGRGGEATQSFSIVPKAMAENTPPAIVSNPRLFAREGGVYTYDAKARDEQGDPVVWRLDAAPSGMSIDSRTGEIRWGVRDDQLGAHAVSLRATDPFGASTVQNFTVTVNCVNVPPLIVSTPNTEADVGDPYLYGVRAIDPDSNSVTVQLLSEVAGMELSSQGLFRWTPTAADAGKTRDIVVQAKDGDGAVTIQKFSVVVSADLNRNHAPVITSLPVFALRTGTEYAYQATATDVDRDKITFHLTTHPAWMSVNETSGKLVGTPTEKGSIPVVLQVRDEKGATSNQGFIVNVRDNQSPTILSLPIKSAVAGTTYRYTVRAEDADKDALTYSLTSDRSDLSIDENGRLLWNVPASISASGPQNIAITIHVRDSFGAEATQAYTLTVTADTVAPLVTLEAKADSGRLNQDETLNAGGTSLVRVFASDNVGVTFTSLEANGRLIPLNAAGIGVIDISQVENIELVATAKDAAGNTRSQQNIVHVISRGSGQSPPLNDPNLPPIPDPIPGDTRPPIVDITSPEPFESVSGIIPITGTIDDPEDNLWFWQVLIARASEIDFDVPGYTDDPDLKVIAQGTEEVHGAPITTFDPTKLDNDVYAIVVVAFDVNQRGFSHHTFANVIGNAKLGQFHLEFTDLSIPLVGIPIQVSRVYDTRQANREGDFGFGWSLGVQDARILETVPNNSEFVSDKTKVYLTNPAGRRIGFTYHEEPISGGYFGDVVYRIEFKPDPGVYDRLATDRSTITRGGVGGAFEIIGAALEGGPLTNRSSYSLTTPDGLVYKYDQQKGLQTITDRNGNVATFTDSGISHSSGQSIQFVRDHRGRIKQIIDPDKNSLLYDYNSAGDLVSVKNQTGQLSTYSYETKPPHFLAEGRDALNHVDFHVTYDEEGRFKAVVDGLGNVVSQQNYDELANRRAIVRDANGNETKLFFDERGNVLTETDAVGNTTTRRYDDPQNPDLETSITDRRGMTTKRTYDSHGNVTQIAELGADANPLSNPVLTKFTYDTQNNVTSITNANGAVTVFSYDDKGHVTKITNALGDSSSFTYDEQGRRQTFTDFNGNTTAFEYDNACPCGAPSKTINADKTYQTFEYNQFGEVTKEQTFEADGTLVEVKTTFYDESGRVTREVTGGGNDPLHPPTDVRKFYAGNLLDWEIIVSPESLNPDGTLRESPQTPVVDRKSRITDYVYDDGDRLIRQIDAMGGIVDFRYDSQGNRIALRDPVGNITTWTYDALNRVAEERDPFYWVELREGSAELTAMTDDAFLSRIAPITRTPGDDPLYDDPSGASLDANQGAPHVRSYGYDGEGNQAEVIDRNNRRREFSYDQAGRLLEERWYAANNGALVETINFTYDALGNMLTASDSNSNYLFAYDPLNRLSSVDNNPDGTRDVPRVILTYGYDAQGNVTLTRDDAGVTVASTYNNRNLLATRQWFDADGSGDVEPARVDFIYNAAGREAQIRRYSDLDATTPVGRTKRTYDLAGRSNLLTHVNAVDALLAGYDYDYNFSGLLSQEARTHQDAQFAQTIDYRYDLSGQLTFADFDTQDDEEYVYDANGNRLSSRVGSEQETYHAGTANQLENDGQYRYEYDGEGNQIKRVDPNTGMTRTFKYDHRNRLVRVDDWSSDPGDLRNSATGAVLVQSVEYTYDAFGDRIAQDVDGATIRSVVNGDSIWMDVDNGMHATRYLFGVDIDYQVSRFAHGNTDWYMKDQLGTVRDVDAPDTIATTRIEYTSSGNIVNDASHDYSDRYLFTGREFDWSINLYYYRARTYDPHTGRFHGEDPLSFGAGDTNLFRYVGNTPTVHSDPTGTIEASEYSSLVSRLLELGAQCTKSLLTGEVVSDLVELTIYMYFTTNGQPYIGRTIQELNTRERQHLAKLKKQGLSIVRGSTVELFKGGVSEAAFAQVEQAFLEEADNFFGHPNNLLTKPKVGITGILKNRVRAAAKFANPC